MRAALSIAEIGAVLLTQGHDLRLAYLEAVAMALPTRIEIEREADSGVTGREELEKLVQELAQEIFAKLDQPRAELKKKT